MHPAILRTLEDWTLHQDFFWFLAALAWAGFLGAALRRKEPGGKIADGWLVALAFFQIGGALVELLLIAQDILIPYPKFDFAMGLAQAGRAGALLWGATVVFRRRTAWRVAAIGLVLGLAAARLGWVIEAGLGLCVLQAGAVLVLLRTQPQVLRPWVAVLFVVEPLVATHGPWAYALDHGRRFTDWSYFALLAASVVAASGTHFAFVAWRSRLREAIPPGAAAGLLRRDLRRAIVVLVVWLGCGMGLAFEYGRQAQRTFETDLLRRVELVARAIDPHIIANTLTPAFQIESLEIRYYPHGAPVEVATIPESRKPIYLELRQRLAEFRRLNPDFRLLHVGAWRDDRLVLLTSGRRKAGNPYVTHIIQRKMEPQDRQRLEKPTSHVEGPNISYLFGAIFEASVPLFHPETREFLGWLTAAVDATRWSATFVQARLQTMALVAAGVGLWTVAVAYRLRREARDAAEQKAAAAAAADRMKSAFLAKVSHELRTPIQSVLGYGELLASAPLGEPHRTWLAALRTHGDVMLRLVNDLIDLGALQSGAFQLEPGPVKLERVIEECAAALRPAAAAKGLRFEMEIAPGLPPWVQTDGIRLRQILLNLLNNAVKFTPVGAVSLVVRQPQRGEIEFVISDTGPGIPASQRLRLFQPFARLDPGAAGGSGLGLALVRGLCGVMGGSVQLADSDCGAQFMVRLPLPACESPTLRSAKTEGLPSLAELRVLLAEDNTLVRDLLVAFLTEQGVHVLVAHDGISALTLARQQAPEVLLLDIALPGLDGIQVAKTLRDEGVAEMRIIGLSAHASSADETRAREAGMDEFLSKPVSLGRLAEVLASHSRRPAHVSVSEALDEALRARLLVQFARETPGVLAELRASLVAREWTKLRRSAHYLKNSADVLGLVALQAACERLYLLSDSPDAAAAEALLDAAEAAIPPELLVLEESS